MSADFARFLADRYDEAEADERALAEWAPGRELFVGTENYGEATPLRDYDPAHRLADIKLKRAILAEHGHYRVDHNWTGRTDLDAPFGCSTCHIGNDGEMYSGGWCATVRQLGTEFAEHPAYKEGWKP